MATIRRRSPLVAEQSPGFANVLDPVSELRERLAEVLHDLHTPLAALSLLALPAPADGSPEDDARRQLRRAVTSLRRQTHILRDHPLFGPRSLRLATIRCELACWSSQLRPPLEELAQARGMELDWAEPEPGAIVDLDPQRFGAAIEHLFLHRSRRSSRPGRLRVAIACRDGDLLVSIGALEARVADPRPPRQRVPAGVEFAAAVIAAHGGDLEDVEGEGGWCEWRIRVPCDSGTDSALGPDLLLDDDAPVRVLVVEDDQALRELLADLLSIRFPVVACRDAAEALRSLEEGVPDLLVVDHGLPDATGIELVRRIREVAGTCIPLLLVTGSTAGEGLASLERMKVLIKPFRGTDLLAQSIDLLKETSTRR